MNYVVRHIRSPGPSQYEHHQLPSTSDKLSHTATGAATQSHPGAGVGADPGAATGAVKNIGGSPGANTTTGAAPEAAPGAD